MHDDRLAHLLRLVYRLAEELAQRDLAYLGLGPGQARVLLLAARNPGMTAVDAWKRLKLTRSTVSAALKALVQVGYLRARPHGRDRRCRAYTPTSLGKALAAEVASVAREHEKALLGDVPAADRERLRRLLLGMVSNLSQEMRHPGRQYAIFPDNPPVARDPSQGYTP